MNPNMMGMGMPMNQVPNVPTTKELWKNEKSKYRHWIILFGLSILVIFALYLTSVILHATQETSIKSDINKWLSTYTVINNVKAEHAADFAEQVEKVANSFWKTKMIWGSIDLTFAFIALVLFASSTIQAYQKKSFAKLSNWASFTIGLVAMMGLFELMQMAWQDYPKIVFHYSAGIYAFILYIIPIPIWLFISRPVAKIKRTFMISERYEAVKKSPQYQAYMQQMEQMQNGSVPPSSMGPYGPMPSATPAQPVKTKEDLEKDLTKAKQAKRKQELSEMSVTDLKKVAKELSLSGYSTMNKDELIDNILRITEGQ